jgi:thiol peroxidase
MQEKLPERAGAVTFKGQPMTLMGPQLKVGDQAPDCTLADNNLQPVQLASFRGKTIVVSSVPSLDTPVCSIETRKFNQAAARIPGVPILTISLDLPFAQRRWCAAEGIDQVITLSDYRDAQFGRKWGLLVKELHLLARCVSVVDRAGVIRYIQLVGEMADEPNYDEVLQAVHKVQAAPAGKGG